MLKFRILFLLQTFHRSSLTDFHNLPRFWTNTGFCPIGTEISETLLSEDTFTMINLLGTLPMDGLQTVRIHWLLDLITDKGRNFSKLDIFVDKLEEANLHPVIEFMSHTTFKWKDLVTRLIQHYITRYGLESVSKWGFETWNEPDLRMYNVLNWTFHEYFEYLHSLHDGFQEVSKMHHFNLSGPAGLFRDERLHPFCWKSLELCLTNCPFQVISFHRKGKGSAWDIVNEGIEVQKEILTKFPHLEGLQFSNTEADPIVTWSIPRDFQADVRYAVILAETVLLHWKSMLNKDLNLKSISHDNAFLSFYPHQFTQRTLLARFQMNNTEPKFTQFILKPVFCVLGMLGYLGDVAKEPEIFSDPQYNLTLLETKTGEYTSYLIAYHPFQEFLKTFSREIVYPEQNTTRFVVVEGLINKVTDPWSVWKSNGSPNYPSWNLRKLLLKSQLPQVLVAPTKINSTFHLRLSFSMPSVYLVRICAGKKTIIEPKNLRLKPVNANEVLLLWKGEEEFCLFSYEVFGTTIKLRKWRRISPKYLPFSHFQYQPRSGTVRGCYKVRSKSVQGVKSKFSEIKCF